MRKEKNDKKYKTHKKKRKFSNKMQQMTESKNRDSLQILELLKFPANSTDPQITEETAI